MDCITDRCRNIDVVSCFEDEELSAEAIEAAILQIRAIRKIDIYSVTREHIDLVITFMKTHQSHVKVQQSACQTIANICMNEEIRAYVIEQKTQFIVLDILRKYVTDWKLCWLACSALWNITLSPLGRVDFPIETIPFFVLILEQHRTQQRVIKVVIGCLSNLALANRFRITIGTRERTEFYFSILSKHIVDVQVVATGAGLVANLAVSDEVANIMVDLNVIPLLKTMLRNQKPDATFQRNIVAALRNCRTGNNFIQECLLNEVVEELFYLLDNAVVEDLVSLPITMICNALNASVAHRPTSFHLSCYHGDSTTFKYLLHQIDQTDTDFIDFNMVDKFSHTLLSYAIEGGDYGIIRYLILCGADKYTQEDDSIPLNIKACMMNAHEEKLALEKQCTQELYLATKTIHFSRDVVDTVMGFVPRYDLVSEYLIYPEKIQCEDYSTLLMEDEFY